MPSNPSVSMFNNCQPAKLNHITKILPLWPFVMRIDSLMALVAMTLGLLANTYCVIEYASTLTINGIYVNNIAMKSKKITKAGTV